MGLCKCPLKKVTNLFCFEHRVNVCDSCLLSNHAQVSSSFPDKSIFLVASNGINTNIPKNTFNIYYLLL